MRARWSGHRIEADATIRVAPELNVLDAHQIAEEVEHELLHQTPHLESVVIHLHPLVPADLDEELHELTAHHRSAEAREAYNAKLAASAAHSDH